MLPLIVLGLLLALAAIVLAPAGDARVESDRRPGVLAHDPGLARSVRRHPQEAGGGELLDLLGVDIGKRRREELVAGELLDEELVERLVGVERADDVIAVAPGVRAKRVVDRRPFRIRVAGDVEIARVLLRESQPIEAPGEAS